MKNYYGSAEQLPELPEGHRYRNPNSSEYLMDVPARLKTNVSRKLTLEEAMYLLSNDFDVDINVHGDPIASESERYHYKSALFVLEQEQKKIKVTKE